MEGPVAYGPDVTHSLHAGNRHAAFENAFPEHLPDLNIMLDAVPVSATRVPGLTRRLVYDYANTPHQRRMTQLMLLPGACVPAHRLTALVDLYVLGGDVRFHCQGKSLDAKAGDFVIMEPDAQLRFESRYGASLLLWAEGPALWEDGPSSPRSVAVRHLDGVHGLRHADASGSARRAAALGLRPRVAVPLSGV
ncbi:hypothetical protein, partial [Achromobacter sp. DMS1]|uniref:hypothetical protein n=1 Tax=Achromobacter sp. DMS1 TaxID=1688405 RepID=UPI000B00CCFD